MAQPVEPMDIDSSVCDFDNKENAFHHNIVQPKTPCTEKGYEELDVSELNMKLRYSMTPAASPMSKSYENKNYESDNIDVMNGNMTRSLHTTLTKNDTFNKSQNTLPLQSLSADHSQVADGTRIVLQPLDSPLTIDQKVTVTVLGPDNDDGTVSLPSSSSSMTHTPEATTPTKEIPKGDGSSPIIRGLKSVLNMFRSSQSPIPGEGNAAMLETLSPPIVHSPDTSDNKIQMASTPLSGQATKAYLTKRNSQNKDSIVFNEDLEKELEWKNDSTILFSNEKIPIHKLYYQQPKPADPNSLSVSNTVKQDQVGDLNGTVEFMDISYNESNIIDKTTTKLSLDLNKSELISPESDGEFVDCESTFTKNELKSQDGSTLNSTEDVLADIIHLVEGNLNDTLNASDARSANSSKVSIETNKPTDTSCEVQLPKMKYDAMPEKPKKVDYQDNEEKKTEVLLKDQQPVENVPVEGDSKMNNLNTIQVINNLCPNEETIFNVVPVVENVCVKSLSQIPLIVDPRVLLFNIPVSSVRSNDDGNVKIGNIFSNNSPADIPLPEDDDMPSLPVMNTELENLSNTLDKIAEETPKINEQKFSISSIKSLSDNQSCSPDMVTLPEVRERSLLETLIGEANNVVNTKLESFVKFGDDKSAHKAKDEVSTEYFKLDKSNTSEIGIDIKTLPCEISEDDNVPPNVPTGVDSEVKINMHTAVKNVALYDAIPELDITLPASYSAETETHQLSSSIKDINFAIESETKPVINENIGNNEACLTQNVFKLHDVSSMDTSIANCNTSEIGIDIKTLPCEISEDYNVPPNVPTGVDSEVKISMHTAVKNVALNDAIPELDITLPVSYSAETETHQLSSSIKDINFAIESETKPVINENIGNIEACLTQNAFKLYDAGSMDISIADMKILTNTDNTQIKSELQADGNFEQGTSNSTLIDHCGSTEIFNTISDPCMTENNIDFIKQQIEEIVTQAIDIAIEKTNAQSDKTSNQLSKPLDINTQNDKNIENNCEMITNNEVLKVSKEIEPEFVSYLNGSTMILCDVETNVPTTFLDHLNDISNLKSTSQENVLENSLHEETKTNDSLKTAAGVKESNSIIKTTNFSNVAKTPVITQTDISDANNIKFQEASVANESSAKEVIPIDMGKAETKDDEVITSENNSPFVLVSEIKNEKEVKPMDDIDNAFETCSKVVKTPPSSPKIVSKGYNFNFDEVDDPFTTKTKIRMSPAPDASPNHTLNENHVDFKPVRKETDRNNRRKSQPERRKPVAANKRLNSTFAGKSDCENKLKTGVKTGLLQVTSSSVIKDHQSTNLNHNTMLAIDTNALDKSQETFKVPMGDNKSTSEILDTMENKNNETFSSEQSSFISAGTSDENTVVKITDLDDPRFNPFASKLKTGQLPPLDNIDNPFATRSRICQTPPPNLNSENPFITKSNISSTPEMSTTFSETIEILANSTDVDKTRVTLMSNDDNIKEPDTCVAAIKLENDCTQETSYMDKNGTTIVYAEDKESQENISGTTCSSNNDKVNTEDEDTVEGPFLESEDLQNDDKMSDFDGDNVDIVQFSESQPANVGNTDFGGELFIDAEAFEFLLNQNQEHTVSDSGKESLFLKFDPLYLKRLSSDGVMSALKQVQIKQSTPKKDEKPPTSRDATFDKTSVPNNADFSSKKPLLPRDATFDMPSIPHDATFDQLSPREKLLPREATFDMSSIPNDATFDQPSPSAGTSGFNTTRDKDLNSTGEESCEDLNVTVAKPMMVVNPAVNPIVTPRNRTMTPVRSNRQSLTFTSPAIAVIDRLLSMSAGNSSILAHDTTVTEVHRDNEADLAITQLRELLAEKEISVYNLRSETKELQNRLASLESHMKTLENISADRLKKIDELNATMNEKSKLNKRMAQVVEEYERTIASLIAETEQDKKRHADERMQLIRERDEQTAHLASMEVSFGDLHSKYEKSKQVILGLKANEETYKKTIKESEDNLTKMQKNYELLKQHATAKLNHANEELQKINRAHEAEVLKMNTMIKRKELHITSLEETLQQKTKANEELTAICDELINKVA